MINTSEFKRDKQNEKITRLLANYESNILQLQAKLKQDLKVNERFKIRKLIKTKQTKERKLKNNILYKVEILKTYYNSYDISINNAEKNKTKVENHLNKVLAKCQKLEPVYRRAQADFLIYRQQKKSIKKNYQYVRQYNKITKKIAKKEIWVTHYQTKINQNQVLYDEIKLEYDAFLNEDVNPLTIEFKNLIAKATVENDDTTLTAIELEQAKNSNYNQKIINKLLLKMKNLENNSTLYQKKIVALNSEISSSQQILEKIKDVKQETLAKVENYQTNKKTRFDYKKLNWEYKKIKVLHQKVIKNYHQKIFEQELIKAKINLLAGHLKLIFEQIADRESKILRIFNRVERILLKDWFFIVICAMLSAGVVLATYLFIVQGIGALNEIFVVAMLKDGLDTGDYTAAMGFAVGFLIARVLEGPLVGILDVGGSILTGVGIGVPAVFLSSQKLAFVMYNPLLAALLGTGLGLIIGLIIFIIRILKPKGAAGLGTDIMIGAGNATGKFLGPLVIFSAATFNPIAGLGAGIGAGIFMWIKKPLVGGAILGAMILGIIPAFI